MKLLWSLGDSTISAASLCHFCLLLQLIPITWAAAVATNILTGNGATSIGAEFALFVTTENQRHYLTPHTIIPHPESEVTITSSEDDEQEYIVSIPPLLEKGPPSGELLYSVTHDPEKLPENLTIPCIADALPTPSYSWFKDGSHFNTDGEGVEMVDGEGTLVFKDPQPEDAGDYQCVATNAAGSVFSDIANVRRSITISFPKGEPRVVTAQFGESLSLQCDNPGGYPKPSLHWVIQKSDGSLRSISSERATVDDTGTLWFSAVTLEDASDDSLYACAASSATSERQLFVVEEDGTLHLRTQEPLEGDFVSIDIQSEYRMGNWVYLNVTIPPRQNNDTTAVEIQVPPFKQRISPKEITVLKGKDLRLFCIYGGLPVPEIRWWRQDDKPIPSENLVEFGKVLEFLDLDEDIDGRFFCEASNEAGESETNAMNVEVESVPVFDVKPGIVNQPIGESATFHCSATGNPEPTITWSFNGEPLGHTSKIYKLESLSVNDRGVIACNATNKHGHDYATGFINVLILPPEFTEKPVDVSGFEGESITLTCKAYGSPDPEIQWSKEDKEDEMKIITDDNDEYELEEEQLVINSLDEGTAGNYGCKAINRFGEVESTATVKVIGATNVDLEISDKKVSAGDDVTLHCSVTVDEELRADITWKKDEHNLDFSNSRLDTKEDFNDDEDSYDRVLVIRNTEGSDSGVYSCLATTGHDEDEAYVILSVEDVPETPHIDEIECSSREAYMKWNAVSENNSPLTGYKIEVKNGLTKNQWEEMETNADGDDRSTKVELHPGLTHIFRITAINKLGESDASAPSEPCISPGLPPDDNPDEVEVETIDASTIKVTWESMEPLEHNGKDFHYEVKWRVHDEEREDDKWSKIIVQNWKATEAEIEGLRAHTEYEIAVEAANEHGTASGSEIVLGITESSRPTSVPTALQVKRVKSKSATLIWNAVPVEDVFGPIKGYEVDIWDADEEDEDDSRELKLAKGHTTRIFLMNLDPYTDYNVRVRVANNKYTGPFSETFSFNTAQDKSSPVTNLEGRSLSSTSLLVEWEKPEDPNGVLLNYEVTYQPIYPDSTEEGVEETGELQKLTTELSDKQAKLSDLKEEALYKISVYPINEAGLGVRSTIEIQTEQKPASMPVMPVFSWDIVEKEDNDGDVDDADVADFDGDGKIYEDDLQVTDRDGDGDIDVQDYENRRVFLKDTDNDGDIDEDDVLDSDGDGDVDEKDIAVADIDNDGDVDRDDLIAGDVDGDGDIDFADIGDEDGDGDIDGADVEAADKNKDGIIEADEDDGEYVIFSDTNKDGIIDESDVTDVNDDGVVDEKDFAALDIDNDGDVDEDDLNAGDTDNDGDIDAADIFDSDYDGDIDGSDLIASDRDGDGDIDESDKRNRNVFLTDADGDGDIDSEDVLDTDRDGDIDEDDFNVADINNDGEITYADVIAGDRDRDGDVDTDDIDDEDGDGDIDGHDVEAADADGDGDIDHADDGEGVEVVINWMPDTEKNPGSEFYTRYRPVGTKYWRKTDFESKKLTQTLRGLDPFSAYEIQIVAKDGKFETPSEIQVVGPFQTTPGPPIEVQDVVSPTMGAVMDESNPWLWTWFVVAIFTVGIMFIIILFSVWVYHRRITQVNELRSQLYEGYVPPPVTASKKGDVEAPTQETEEAITAEKQRAQMAALLRRQETVQSVDSFASHDDDFAEYGDETMVGQTETLV